MSSQKKLTEAALTSVWNRPTLWWIILAVAIFLPRLISLGTILTVDEPLWINRGQTFITSLASGHFDKTLTGGQPGVTTTWLVGLTTPSTSLAVKQASVGIATGLLILLAAYFFTQLYDLRWGMVTGYMLALDPFLLGHSRVVHTDGLQALFYLTSILIFLSALGSWQKKQPVTTRYIIASGILAGAAILTKISSLVIIPTGLCIMALLALKHRAGWHEVVRTAGTWGTCIILAVYVAWPALWFNADHVFGYLSERTSAHTEGTRAEETTSLPWYYERELAFRLATTTALLAPFGLWHLSRHRKEASQATAWLLLSGIMFIAAVSLSSDKSDRYILFAMLTFIPLAAMGVKQIVSIARNIWPQAKGLPALLMIAPSIYLAADDIRLHPYYLAHYNRLYPIETTHKLGWGEGLEQAAKWITQQNPNAKVLTYYPRVFSYFYGGETETITHLNDVEADYIVVYRSMLERAPESPEGDITREYLFAGKHTPVHTIQINGLPYIWIFAGSHQ